MSEENKEVEKKEEVVEPVEKVEEVKETPKTEQVERTEPVKTIEKAVEPAKKETAGFSIAALVLGIIAIILCCVVYISAPCAALAIIFGAIGMKKSGRGMAIAGLVLGIITMVMLAFLMISGMAFLSAMPEFMETMESIEYSSY